MSLDSTLAIADDLRRIRNEIVRIQSEKDKLQGDIDPLNARLVELRSQRDAKIAQLKTEASQL